MSDRPPVAGVRLRSSGPVLWVESAEPNLQPGALCLLQTPTGERTARCTVAPRQLAGEVTPLAGHSILRTLTPDEAQNHEPARSLRVRIEQLLGGSRREVRVEPDGSRAVLLSPETKKLTEQARRLTAELGLPVTARTPGGRVPDPDLPSLLANVRYKEQSAVVEQISVFRGEIALRSEHGLQTVTLQDWYLYGCVESD
ncbi:MAG: hypothetical protein M3P51_11525 [Chloroflexota bacterium]|nr:hypothetical protein [Chloroflexota bacterium]